jgi:hypothetical protein
LEGIVIRGFGRRVGNPPDPSRRNPEFSLALRRKGAAAGELPNGYPSRTKHRSNEVRMKPPHLGMGFESGESLRHRQSSRFPKRPEADNLLSHQHPSTLYTINQPTSTFQTSTNMDTVRFPFTESCLACQVVLSANPSPFLPSRLPSLPLPPFFTSPPSPFANKRLRTPPTTSPR